MIGDTLHVLYGSRLYVCLDLGLYNRSLESLLEECTRAISAGIVRKAVCGCAWRVYERGRELQRIALGERQVVVKG